MKTVPKNSTESEQALAVMLDRGLWNGRTDRGKAVLLIRLGVPLHVVSQARSEYRTWTIVTQREFQASISRRPTRGRHHDSWAIREKYVRCQDDFDLKWHERTYGHLWNLDEEGNIIPTKWGKEKEE